MTLLKDMQFNRPVLGGVVESNNAKFVMGINDKLVFENGNSTIDIITYDANQYNSPFFSGTAASAGQAYSAYSADSASYAYSARSADTAGSACYASRAGSSCSVYVSGGNYMAMPVVPGCLSYLPACARLLYIRL